VYHTYPWEVPLRSMPIRPHRTHKASLATPVINTSLTFPSRLSSTSKTPITYTFGCRPVLLVAGAFPRSPVEWNSNVGWDEIDTLYVAPHLAHMCSPSFLHSFRLPFNSSASECLRLSPPCCRQVNFRRCTVIATNYGRARSVEQSRTHIMTTVKRMQAV
jgi:hypothetical protein